jgi:cell wall-associated NlpC family hydrolase
MAVTSKRRAVADMRAIGPLLTAAETAAFIAEARTYLDPPVRFRHQGRSRRGVDCAGLLLVSMAAIGRPIVDLAAYGREPIGGKLRAVLADNLGDPVPKADMRPGDVVLMRFRGEPSHVGMIGDYLYGGLSLIHTFAQVKKVVEHRLDEEWAGYITEVFRP